jgi:FimV-like protein
MMNDFDQARIILKGVMEKGTEEHLREAEGILNKIKNATGH